MLRLLIAFILISAMNVHADSFQGIYIALKDGEKISLSLTKTSNRIYQGLFKVEGENFSFSAYKQGENLTGSLLEKGEDYSFIAYPQGRHLMFEFANGETIQFNASARSKTSNQTSVQPIAKSSQSLPASSRAVYVNGKPLSLAQLQQIETTYQTKIENGRYWYDHKCGAWGVQDGPTVGFIVAGLKLPGPMSANSSGGGTGIFINGREIHPLDQKGLQQLFGVTYQGRYWLDAQGNLGIENGPFIVNIVAMIQNAQRQQSSSDSITHGYGNGSGSRGTLGGGMYSGRTASGKSVFWYPGM